MAKIEKLKSGNYRIRVYDKATKSRKSFTASSKKEVKLLAAEYENGIKSKAAPRNLSVSAAVREYIDSKSGVLSPSTIRGYEIILRNAFKQIGDTKLRSLSEMDVQKWISTNAKTYKTKSLKNQLGLLSAALRMQRVHLDLDSIKMPAAEKYEPNIPTEEEIAHILTIVEGTNVELPVTIAVTLGLRQSEIAALKWEDYDGEFLYVHSARVPDKDNKLVVKDTTKSKASTRTLEVDAVLKTRLDRTEHKSEFISTMQPNSVLKRFQQLCEREGLPHFTMHGQRHGNASLMLAQGVPDKYAMERLGQSSPSMIKNIYQHLYDTKKKEISQTMSSKFSDILSKVDTKVDTSNKK